MSKGRAVATSHFIERLQSLAPARDSRDIALAAAILSANGFRSIEELVGACAADLCGQGRPLGPSLGSFLAELIRLAEARRRAAGASLSLGATHSPRAPLLRRHARRGATRGGAAKVSQPSAR